MRRLSANYIFPVDKPPIKNGIIEVEENGTIINVIDTQNKETAGTEFYNGILVPGFVNTHCHLELSYLKGKIPGHQKLAGFIESLKNIRSEESSEIIAAKADFFDKLMWQNGIVAVGDISNDTTTFPIKKESKIYYHTFIEFFGLIPEKAEKTYSAVKEKLNTLNLFKLNGNLVPHAPYSISPSLFNFYKTAIHAPTEIVSVHFQETESENTYFKHQTGDLFNLFKKWGMPFPFNSNSSIDYLLENIPPHLNTIFVHNTFAGADAINKIKTTDEHPFLCLCPNANLYIENQLPDIPLIQNSDIPITLGTDSLASNNSLSILEEMKTIQHHFPDIPFHEILNWATINGAGALKLDNNFGSITVGKKPGINLVENMDLKNLKLLPESIVRKLI